MRLRRPPNGSSHNLLLRTILAIVIAGAPTMPLAAQSQRPDWQAAAGGRMSFDSATVTPNKAGIRAPTISNFPLGPGDVYVPNGGQFRAMGFSLSGYIVFAYKLSSSQEEYLLSHLPKWATTERFDIQAKAHGNPTKDQMRLMVQSLLADRFRLSGKPAMFLSSAWFWIDPVSWDLCFKDMWRSFPVQLTPGHPAPHPLPSRSYMTAASRSHAAA